LDNGGRSIDAHEFRNQILAAREALRVQGHHVSTSSTTSHEGIERRLNEIIRLLKDHPL